MVVADDVLVEDRDVAAGGADVEVPEQGGADVNGQAVVHQLGGEQPSEVVRGEVHVGELRMRGRQLIAGASDDAPYRGAGHAALAAAVDGLEEVGQFLAPDLLVQLVSGADRNGAMFLAVAADDLRDDVEQFGRHGDDAFAVALGRADDQERDNLAVRALVLPDAEVAQFGEFLGAQAGPSFLWMMYRSGWGTKTGQETVLAVEIARDGFEWALRHACLSSYVRGLHPDRSTWQRRLKRAPARVQWDPERDLRLQPLPHRSLQLGLSGEAVRRYADEWTVSISDVTPLAHRIHALVGSGDPDSAARLLPEERAYPVGGELMAHLRS
jgi:hypothetical protein